MLQQDTPEDFVIATGEQHSVREFVDAPRRCSACAWNGAARALPNMGSIPQRPHGRQDRSALLPAHRGRHPAGDPDKAQRLLGWRAEISFEALIAEMVAADLELARRDSLIAREGFKTYQHRE